MGIPIITRDDLKNLINAGQKNCVLIDVREPDELSFGTIPTAVNIPLGELQTALAMPPEVFQEKYGFPKITKKDNLIFYCRTGQRAQTATQFARVQGFNARNYAGSIWEWAEIDSSVKRYGPDPQF